MPIVTNYLLFSHTYLRQLQSDDGEDQAAAAVAQGVREWHGFKDARSRASLIDSWVTPLLQILELDLQPLAAGDGDAHWLYAAWDAEAPVGLCYVTPPGADLDSTTKGRHWMARAVLAARNAQSPIPNHPSVGSS